MLDIFVLDIIENFVLIVWKKKNFFCNQCRYNKQHKNQQQRQQQNEFKSRKNYLTRTNIINLILASLILFLGIILVLTSFLSLINVNNSDSIISEEIKDNKKNNNDKDAFIYIFPFPFAIPIESNISFIIPLILILTIAIPIILFIIILKSIKLF
jgi:hypothetical protein